MKDKKQKLYQAKQDCDWQKDNTLAFEINTIVTKKKTYQNQGYNQNQNRDVSKITYYNSNIKSYYAKACTKPKSSLSSQ